MVRARSCSGRRRTGEACSAPPLRDGDFCFWHDPGHQTEAGEARRLGGLRRKREGTLQGAYEIEGLSSVSEIRRVLEVAVLDALALDNSIARVRALVAASQAAVRLLEVGEVEGRLEAVEAALNRRR